MASRLTATSPVGQAAGIRRGAVARLVRPHVDRPATPHPSTTTFDYEFALAQHQFGARAATRVVVPEAIPAERLRRYGLRPPKLARYPGLKEEYYLADFEPDPAVPGSARRRSVAHPRRTAAAPRRRPVPPHGNPLFPRTLELLGRRADVHAVVLPRTTSNEPTSARSRCRRRSCPSSAVDAQSLIAAADLVISAGGTMNREAVALGVPVYTEFAGRLGGVDEQLIREGRLRVLTDPPLIDLRKRDPRLGQRVTAENLAICWGFFFLGAGKRSSVRNTSRSGRRLMFRARRSILATIAAGVLAAAAVASVASGGPTPPATTRRRRRW